MENHSIHSISLEEFLTGSCDGMDSLDVDEIFGKDLERILREIVDYDSDSLNPEEGCAVTRSFLNPDIRFCQVSSGLVALNSDNRIIGGYISCDVSIDAEYQGRGIGKELILEYFLRNEDLPTWHLDVPAYTSSGLASHQAAWEFAQTNPAVVLEKINAIEFLDTMAPKANIKLRP